jgi:hypothetical protein
MALKSSDLRTCRVLLPGRFPVLISVGYRVKPRVIVRLDGFGKLKDQLLYWESNSDLPVYIAKCINQVRYSVPLSAVIHVSQFHGVL